MRRRLAIPSLSLALLIGAAPAVAKADPTFPGKIQMHLGLSYTPPCNICHTSPAGFPAPASEPFGLAMIGAGLTAPDLTPSTVGPALDAIAAKMPPVDSDCDGIPDVDQLKDGRDPNRPGEYIDSSGKATPAAGVCSADAGTTSTPTLPSYGCGAQLAPAATPWQGAAVLVAALGAALARRRSAASARRARRSTEHGAR